MGDIYTKILQELNGLAPEDVASNIVRVHSRDGDYVLPWETFMDLLVRLEKQFGIEFQADHLELLEESCTVSDIEDAVDSSLYRKNRDRLVNELQKARERANAKESSGNKTS